MTKAVVLGWLAVSALASSPAAGQDARSVTIHRDPWGVPHAYATDEAAGFHGLGYAQAQDRLQALLGAFLAVRGEAASVVGPGAVDRDSDQLLFRHLEESRAGLARIPPQLRRNYGAFIAGIQRYLDEHPDQVPEWAPPLEPALPMAVFRSFLWSRLLFDGVTYWARPGPRDGKCSRPTSGRSKAPGSTPGYDGMSGSNEWALAPWRTSDGVVIHLGDPHGGYHGVWEFRIDAGPMKAAATSFPGNPLPFIGHTRHVAWAFSLFGTDGFDCYVVLTDKAKPRRYRYDGTWQTMETRRVTVRVKDAKPVKRTLEYTRHNGILSPVVRRSGDTAFVLSIPDMHQAGLYDEQFYRLALARGLDDLKGAIDPGFISANAMAGTSDGHTYYVRGGYVPRRPSGFDFRLPVPGNTSATAWLGMHSLADHVTLEDPPVGYMSNNNIAPDMMLDRGSPDLRLYPWYLYDDRPGRTTSRGVRAIEVLSRAYDVTVDDALELALDDKWVGVDRWQAALTEAANADAERIASSSAEYRRFLGRLLSFDGWARKESKGALAFYYWWTAMRRDTAQFRTLWDGIERGSPPPDARAILLAGVDSAHRALRLRHGGTEARFGDEFRAGRGGVSHPVGSAGLPGLEFLGDVLPLRATSFTRPDSAGLRWARGGGYHTTLTIFTDPIQSFSLTPLGHSNDPASPHHSDQAIFMSERRLKPTLFNREDLEQATVSSITLLLPPQSR